MEEAIQVINDQIRTGVYSSVYLFCGEEKYLIDFYLKTIVGCFVAPNDTLNCEKLYSPSEDRLAEACLTLPFFSDKKVVIVYDSGFLNKANNIQLTDIAETTILILVEKNVDKRNRLYKAIKKDGSVLEFKTPSTQELSAWVKKLVKQQNKTIESAAVNRILASAENDMYSVLHEVEKVLSCCYDYTSITLYDIDQVCGDNTEGRIFDMIEAVATGNSEKVMDIYRYLLQQKEAPIKILSLIIRQYMLILNTKMCLKDNRSDKEIAQVIGVPVWAVKKYKSQAKLYQEDKLVQIANLCTDVDYKIKSTSVSDQILVESLIVMLSNKIPYVA